MDDLRAWAMTVCAAAMVCGLCYRLFPDNSLGKQGRLLLPCLFVVALLLPFNRVRLSLDHLTSSPTAIDSTALEARMQQQTTVYVNDMLLSMANQALASYGAEVKKVTADVHFTADGGIDMGQITIYIDKDTLNMAAVVRQIVEHRLGTSVVLAQWEDTSS